MSLRRRALQGATWSIFAGNASQLIAIAFFLAISRLVGPTAFGLVAIALAIIELSRAVVTESLASILVARKTYAPEDYDAALPIALSVSGVMSVLIFTSAPWLEQLYQTPGLSQVLAGLAWLIPIQAAARVQDDWLRRQMRFDSLALRWIGSALAGGAAGLWLALEGQGVLALMVQQIIMAIAACVLVWAGSAWRPSLKFEPARLRSLLKSASTLTPASLLGALNAMLDSLAAGLAGATAAGIYGLAKRIRQALQFGLSSGLTRAALPAFAESNARPGGMARAAHETLRLAMFLTFPVFVGVAAVAPELITLVLDERWRSATQPLFFLLLAGPLQIAASLMESTLLIEERRRTVVVIKALTIGVLACCLTVATPYGAVVIAAAALGATVFNNLATFHAAAKTSGLSIQRYAAAVGGPFVLSLLMYAMIEATRATALAAWAPWFRLPALILLGAAFYMAAACLIARPALAATWRAARTLVRG